MEVSLAWALRSESPLGKFMLEAQSGLSNSLVSNMKSMAIAKFEPESRGNNNV
jgi:hypothetical protein